MPGPAEICRLTNDCLLTSARIIAQHHRSCDCPVTRQSTYYQPTLSYAKFPVVHFVTLLNNPNLVPLLPFPDFVVSTGVEIFE